MLFANGKQNQNHQLFHTLGDQKLVKLSLTHKEMHFNK